MMLRVWFNLNRKGQARMNLTEIFLNKLKAETKQVSSDSLFNDEWEVKRTLYAPPYQRNYVRDGEKATYFLESILIGT